MKTKNFKSRCFNPLPRRFYILLLFAGTSITLNAQDEAPDSEAAVKLRPETSDTASQQLIRNYLVVTGGSEAHRALANVVARGRLTEAGKSKGFELIELQDGRRHLTLTWRHLGRDFEEQQVFNGEETWRQELRPEKKDPEVMGGPAGKHFSTQRWLLQPFVRPAVADYTFNYHGTAKVGGRPCYVVIGFGKEDVRSWFYFDREKSLLLRWGGIGELAGGQEYMDYRASRFKRQAGVLLPLEIELLAEEAAFGSIEFEAILASQEIDATIFNKPQNQTPVLRQRPAQGR